MKSWVTRSKSQSSGFLGTPRTRVSLLKPIAVRAFFHATLLCARPPAGILSTAPSTKSEFHNAVSCFQQISEQPSVRNAR